MLRQLFVHQWRSYVRSPFLSQSMVQSFILGFFALYMIVSFFALGYILKDVLEELLPDFDVLSAFSRLTFYYFTFDLIIRFFLQQYPSMGIKPYLTLPVPKKILARSLLAQSLFSFFNVLPFFFILPFFFRTVLGYGLTMAFSWFAYMVIMVLLSNFLSFFISKTFGSQPIIAITILLLTGGLCYLDFNGYVPISLYFGKGVDTLLKQPLLLFLPVIVLLVVYKLLVNLLVGHTHLEDLTGNSDETVSNSLELNAFDRYGRLGELIRLEVLQVWRNKRARLFLFMSGLFVLYPLIFLGNNTFPSKALQVLIGLITTGGFALNYGQLLLSWNSTHFDFILSNNISIKEFFKAKYYLLAGSSLMLCALAIPYGFVSLEFGFIVLAMGLFNAGCTVYVYMFFSNFNSKRIDPNVGGMFNMEGFGGGHYLIMLPIMALPLMIFLPCHLLGYTNLGILLLALIGLLGILLRENIIQIAVNQFKKRKYIIAADFRKK